MTATRDVDLDSLETTHATHARQRRTTYVAGRTTTPAGEPEGTTATVLVDVTTYYKAGQRKDGMVVTEVVRHVLLDHLDHDPEDPVVRTDFDRRRTVAVVLVRAEDPERVAAEHAKSLAKLRNLVRLPEYRELFDAAHTPAAAAGQDRRR